jgi:3-hydroxyacyl-CoA dehydrogenase
MCTESVGRVGLGLLGRGIAACLAEHGFDVLAMERPGLWEVLAPLSIHTSLTRPDGQGTEIVVAPAINSRKTPSVASSV